ncbi:hypothetical protein B0T22DRAFT_450622 [Podospora appendiculata]|uniref:Secreted protein n=1 Tax=Podospora appendiculata TaxID=314037 RepID=A0AAE1CGX5_9PEZI|nr:hypothetical protein B0T22DRAFT_450622 [Podospora appendiculata]
MLCQPTTIPAPYLICTPVVLLIWRVPLAAAAAARVRDDGVAISNQPLKLPSMLHWSRFVDESPTAHPLTWDHTTAHRLLRLVPNMSAFWFSWPRFERVGQRAQLGEPGGRGGWA